MGISRKSPDFWTTPYVLNSHRRPFGCRTSLLLLGPASHHPYSGGEVRHDLSPRSQWLMMDGGCGTEDLWKVISNCINYIISVISVITNQPTVWCTGTLLSFSGLKIQGSSSGVPLFQNLSGKIWQRQIVSIFTKYVHYPANSLLSAATLSESTPLDAGPRDATMVTEWPKSHLQGQKSVVFWGWIAGSLDRRWRSTKVSRWSADLFRSGNSQGSTWLLLCSFPG